MNLRNIAIIALVDHGKTTLVDQLLAQPGVFRANESHAERAMDSNDQERERGITILAKATSVLWHGAAGETRITIIDTPGHADPVRVRNDAFDLFASMGATDEQLDFPHLYASGKQGWATLDMNQPSETLGPLFDKIVEH